MNAIFWVPERAEGPLARQPKRAKTGLYPGGVKFSQASEITEVAWLKIGP